MTKVFGTSFEKVLYKNTQRIAFEKSRVLKDLSAKQRELVIGSMKIVNYAENAVVVQKGALKGNKLMIILKGKLAANGNQYSPSQCIGDNELLLRPMGKYEDNLLSVERTDLAEISREEIEKLLQGDLKSVLEKNLILSILKHVQIFRSLPPYKIESLISILRSKEYKKQQYIFFQNEPGLNFFIIKEGEVEIIKEGIVVRTLGEFDYFGERSIILKENRTASARAKDKLVVWVLQKEDFLRVIDAGMRDQLLSRIRLQDDNLSIKDLILVKLLGKGTFSNVFLSINQKTNTAYALKGVARKIITNYQMQENLGLERKILLKVDHPFIVKLVKTLKESQRLYFVLEYVRGNGLFETLKILDLLKNEGYKFYVGSLLLILEHLHERNIVYRNLKPENIMIDEEGYLKLIDFGTAKIVDGKSFTMVGTPHYMAPEVILGKGYSFPADIWSLGIMTYEFVTKTVPFANNEQDPYKVYEKILAYNLTYPVSLKHNSKVKIFIDQLLAYNPAGRGTAESIKSHKWFTNFEWESLLSKQLKPPYVPIVNSLNSELAKSNIVSQDVDLLFIKEENFENSDDFQIFDLDEDDYDWDFEF